MAALPGRRAAGRSDGDGGRMTLAEHIRELRARLIKSALAILAAAILAYVFYDPIFKVLTHPYCTLAVSHGQTGRAPTGSLTSGNVGCHLYFFHPLDAFAIRLRVAILAGVLLSSPVWLYQVWAFITPGLRRNERRWALSFVASSAALFAVGALLAYVTLPKALNFLLGAVGNNAINLLGIDQYLTFTTQILIIFGASFELPLLLVILNLAGLLSASRMAHWFRPAVFLLFVFAAVITPSQDPITMSVMGGGLSLLYGVAVLIARANDRRRAIRRQQLLAALDSNDPAAAVQRLKEGDAEEAPAAPRP
jgi:sec-independent protein translocase protein TatC